QRVEMVSSEIEHAEHAGSARVELATVANQVCGLHQNHGEPSRAEDTGHDAAQGQRLQLGCFAIQHNAAGRLAGGSARLQDLEDFAFRDARKKVLFEQGDGKVRKLGEIVRIGAPRKKY